MLVRGIRVCVSGLQELSQNKLIKQFVRSDSRDTHDIWTVQRPSVLLSVRFAVGC